MKKIAVAIIVFCLLAVSAFAQIVNVGGYAKSYWVPYRMEVPEKGDAIHSTALQTGFGRSDISAAINVDAWSQWGGFHLNVDVANGASNQVKHPLSALGAGWIWIKPLGFIPVMESFTLWYGTAQNERLTGKIDGSELFPYVLNNSWVMRNPSNHNANRNRLYTFLNPEFNIFTRLNPAFWGSAENPAQNTYWPRAAASAMITWEPAEKIFIGLFFIPEAFNLIDWNNLIGGAQYPSTESANGNQVNGTDGINEDYYDAKTVYKKMQAAVGYNMPGVGFARLQYLGLRNVIEAAYQINSLGNLMLDGDLMIDMGIKIPFENLTDETDIYTYKKKKDFQFSAAAIFRYLNFRMLGRVDTAFAGSDSSRPGQKAIVRGLNMIVYLIPSYQLSMGIVGADIAFEYEQKDEINEFKEDSTQAGLGIWFQRSLGNAHFKAAAVARLPLSWNGEKQNFNLFFPVYMEVNF